MGLSYCDVALPVPLHRTFTYAVPGDLPLNLGSCVHVSFGRRKLSGFVVGFPDTPPDAEIKPVESVESDDLSLPAELLELGRWVSDYYLAPLGEVLRAALPAGLGKRTPPPLEPDEQPVVVGHKLNARQERAVDVLRESMVADTPRPVLLYGVTGSGKTEVYLRAAEQALSQGGSVILLVPEIALSPQMLHRVKERFGNRAALWHSSLTPGERRHVWTGARRGEIQVVVGARSAVFAPLPNLKLIVVDEEHEQTYKQGESPRYHARDVALVRGRQAGAQVVLGSATPSLESMANAARDKYALVELPERVASRPQSRVHLSALPWGETDEDGRPPVSELFAEPLRTALAETLSRKEQAIVFLNRRGHSTVVRCRGCREVVECPHCDVVLTYHTAGDRLACHYCGLKRKAPKTCEHCGEAVFAFRGAGTQKVETELERLFPTARILRLDTDVARKKGALNTVLERFRTGEAEILLGTQMVAKGLDFPNVTLVGVVNADTQLHLPDFRSAERTFQLLSQVAGRAGRGDRPGRVYFQTANPDTPALVAAAAHDYRTFFEEEFAVRAEVGWPPHKRLVNLMVDGKSESTVRRWITQLGEALRREVERRGLQVDLLGPAPQPVSRLKGQYRWHITLRGARPAELKHLARLAISRAESGLKGARLAVDVDPVSLL